MLPLDDRTVELFGARFRDRSPHREDRHYTYRPPLAPLPSQVGAAIGGRSWELRATVDRPAGAGGVLFASGTANAGLSVFVQDDRLVFDYNAFGDHTVVQTDEPVPEGRSELGVRFVREAKQAVATLLVDGQERGSTVIPLVMRIMSSTGPSVGADHGSPVSERYTGPFPFAGELERVDIQLLSRAEAGAAEAEARAAMARQ